jgi:outer membrane protein assembly factor BamB
MATPALAAAGNLLLADMEGSVHALAPDGTPAFHYVSGADYLLSGPVCSADGHTFVGDPLGRLHVVDRKGAGGPVFEAARSIQARPAFDRQGDLYVPSTDRTVYVFRNLASG